jgi:hypothetical protein
MEINNDCCIYPYSILEKQTLLVTHSKINDHEILHNFGIEERILITNDISLLKRGCIISHGTRLIVDDLKLLDDNLYLDITDLANITKYPKQFHRMMDEFYEVMINKKIIEHKIKEISTEIDRLKISHENKINELQIRSCENLFHSVDNTKITKDITEQIIMETKDFKEKIEKENNIISKLENSLLNLNDVFYEIAFQSNDCKYDIEHMFNVINDVLQFKWKVK